MERVLVVEQADRFYLIKRDDGLCTVIVHEGAAFFSPYRILNAAREAVPAGSWMDETEARKELGNPVERAHKYDREVVIWG